MLMIIAAVTVAAVSPPSAPVSQARPPSVSSIYYELNPQAAAFVERDPQIKAWAVRRYDINHDGWLTTYDAEATLDGFRSIADSDRDGRVTVRKYGDAVNFIAARD